MEQKKKSSNYIIPATFFTSLSPSVKKTEVKPVVPKTSVKVVEKSATITSSEVPKPTLKNVKRRTSALSFKSLQEKKEIKVNSDEEENFDNHPKSLFSHDDLKDAWKKYYFQLQRLGEQSIAAILASDEPKLLENFTINFAVPSELMKSQLEKGKPKLLRFLREKLNNYGVQINVKVNETIEKKFAYTPQEKYDKLKEKNPLLEKLKNTFGLDV